MERKTKRNVLSGEEETVNTIVFAAWVFLTVGAFIVVDANTGDWTDRTLAGTVEFDRVTYNVYMYRYKALLDVNAETSDVITAAYLAPQLDYDHDTNRFVMDGAVIADYVPGESIDIYVAAQAIQAAGFADYDAALNNFTTHPWAN